MTNEEIVLKRLGKVAKSPLYFSEPNRLDYIFDVDKYKYDLEIYKNRVEELKEKETIEDRVREIFLLCTSYDTRCGNNRFQCRSDANRSAHDIWRIYKFYFGDIDIFPILRAIYKLAVKDRFLNGYRCPAVRKQVFWPENYGGGLEIHSRADLGVPTREWENIGL